uniref:Rhodanese domain-containing protein n=1 Tax=Magnetococcus massalia (strain MO-1) TaxID=451514 RepID=A0A1S7LHZ6_MAGMO|nr:Putative protein with Rhodanese domain [Candidatus Magnetococcus massalia]
MHLNLKKMLRPVVVLLAALLMLSGCEPPPYTNINNEELKELLAKGVPLFDVRRPDEWKQTGVVEGSKLLTYVNGQGRIMNNFVPRFTAQVKPEQPVIVICRTGNRTSHLAKQLMEKLGYQKVYNVRAGITNWIKARNPVVRAKL